MKCACEGCGLVPAKRTDLFCEVHWRKLPHWARQELIRLRNAAPRGGQHASDFAKGAAAAVHLLKAP